MGEGTRSTRVHRSVGVLSLTFCVMSPESLYGQVRFIVLVTVFIQRRSLITGFRDSRDLGRDSEHLGGQLRVIERVFFFLFCK